MSDTQKSLQYLAQIASDYANTLAPSARGPFLQAAQKAVDTLQRHCHPAPPVYPPGDGPLDQTPGHSPQAVPLPCTRSEVSRAP